MTFEHKKSVLASRITIKSVSYGLVLGACIGVLGVFLITKFVFRDNHFAKTQRQLIEVYSDQTSDDTPVNIVEFTKELQIMLGFDDRALPMFERFGEEKLVGLRNFIEETKQLEINVRPQSLKKMLLRELARIDPATTLNLVPYWTPSYRYDLVQLIFEEWSKEDVRTALKATEQLSPSQWQAAIGSILRSQPNQSQRIEEYAKTQGMENNFDRLVRDNEILEMLNDRPEEAWRAILNDDVSNELQEDLIFDVLDAWIYRDGYHVLSQIYEFRHKFDRIRLEEVLSRVVQHHPDEAFRIVVSLSKERLNWLLPIVMEAWSKQEPEAAYYALETVENFNAIYLTSTIVRQWARSDPASVLQQLESIPRFLREDAATSAMSELTYQNPLVAKEFLSNWQEVLGIDVSNLEKILVRDWARQNAEDAFSWIQERVDSASPRYAQMLQDVLLNIAPDNPDRALEIALSQPNGSLFMRLLFENLVHTLGANGHIDNVMSILDQIPYEAHLGTFSALSGHLISENRWEDAIQLSDRVPEESRTWYFSKLAFHGILTNVSTLIEQLDSLPSDQMRTAIAKEILRWHENERRIISDEQLKNLRSIASGTTER